MPGHHEYSFFNLGARHCTLGFSWRAGLLWDAGSGCAPCVHNIGYAHLSTVFGRTQQEVDGPPAICRRGMLTLHSGVGLTLVQAGESPARPHGRRDIHGMDRE